MSGETYTRKGFEADCEAGDVEVGRHRREEIRGLLDDNDRLRALIKDAEWSSMDLDGPKFVCPWCKAPKWSQPWLVEGKHLDTCPAFTPDGTVR